jgi:DNA-binding transcriptional regulator YbjK
MKFEFNEESLEQLKKDISNLEKHRNTDMLLKRITGRGIMTEKDLVNHMTKIYQEDFSRPDIPREELISMIKKISLVLLNMTEEETLELAQDLNDSRRLLAVAYGPLKMMADADGCNCRVCQAAAYEEEMLAIKPLTN